ncbi:hypothetical protein [Haloarchaeobius baliensis]|uniref:hypothetical protein n=1 Tax=Haloarchaeobius baliensis TaxID=1670458 RepID=UPI003F8834E8
MRPGNAENPEWVGQTSAGLSLVNVSWEDWGNPNPDFDDGSYQGCWRYTFSASSLALALRLTEVPSGNGTRLEFNPDHPSVGYDRYDDGYQSYVGTELTVRGPSPGDGEQPRNAAQNVDISPRHDPQLFSVIDGRAMREQLITSCQDPELRAGFGDIAGMNGGEHARNGKQAIQQVREHNQDAMAVTGVGLGAASLAVAGLATVLSGGTVLLVAGASLTVASVITEILKLLGDRSIDWLPPNAGFRVRAPTDGAEPVAGYNVVFDAYVTPGSRTFVTVGTEHPVDRDPRDRYVDNVTSLADYEWKVDIDAPPAPHEADVGDQWKYSSAWLSTGTSFSRNRGQPPIPGYERLSSTARDVCSVPIIPGIEPMDVYRLGDTVRLRATEPIRTTSGIQRFEWDTEHETYGTMGTWCGPTISPETQSGREFEIDCDSYGIWRTELRVTDQNGNTGRTTYRWEVRRPWSSDLGITSPEPGNELAAAEFPDDGNPYSVDLTFEADTGDGETIDATWSYWGIVGGGMEDPEWGWVEFSSGSQATIRWTVDGRNTNELAHPLRVKFEEWDCTGQRIWDTMTIERLRSADDGLGGVHR